MASYHLAVKSVSRAAGRSATGAAAYRLGVRIEDERTGLTHDYSRRHGVEHTSVILPAGAPDWAADHSRLWNAAEQAEKRKDAKVAREYEIALPAELSADARRELAEGFARHIADRYGVAVDLAIHAPGGEGDQRNHHAHLLTTTRQIGPDGLGKKTRELDIAATAATEVEHLRETWAGMQNRALKLAQVPERVDHRSNERRGIKAEPTVHMGPAVSAMERRAQRQAKQEDREHQPVTLVGQHNADAKEKRGLRLYIERGVGWLHDTERRVRELAAALNDRIERNRRATAEAERVRQEQVRLRQEAERQKQAEIARKQPNRHGPRLGR